MVDSKDGSGPSERGEVESLRRRVEELEAELSRVRDSNAPPGVSLHRLRLANDLAGIGMWEWDVRADIIHWSDACLEVFGVDRAVFDGSFEGYIGYIHPDDHDSQLETIERAMKEFGPFDTTHRIVLDDGTVRHLHGMGSAFAGEDGELAWMTGIVVDVTEQHRNAGELERMVNQLAEAQGIARMGSFEWSRDEDLMQVSSEIYRIFDFDPERATEASAQSYFDFIHPDDHDEIMSGLAAARESESGRFVFEHRIVREDGDVRHLKVEGRFDMAEDGRVSRSVGTLKDITNDVLREQAERSFEQRLLRSQKLEALGQLAGGVAHDFNNLLTAIMGNVAIMRRRASRQEGHYAADSVDAGLREIEHAARRATDLTRQLLAFGRRPIGRPDPVDLNQTITSMGEMLARLIGEHIHLDLDLADQSTVVRVDATQLEQVILNLVINARDAMPEGGLLTIATFRANVGEEDAELEPDGRAGDHVVVRVQDTGAGIPKDVVERIFEPFFTTKAAGEGTGLGLATVYGAVRQASGHCSVQSEPGKGTIFDVRFPAVDEEVQVVGTEEREPALGGEEVVLVCEDDAQVRQVTSEILRSRGYRVIEAADGHAALRVVEADRVEVDLLVTDVVMPHVDGRTLARQFLEKRPDLPVVFVSGYTPESPIDGSSSFPGPLVQKPFSAEHLLSTVRRALDGARSGD